MHHTYLVLDIIHTMIYVEYSPVSVDSLLPARLWKNSSHISLYLFHFQLKLNTAKCLSIDLVTDFL